MGFQKFIERYRDRYGDQKMSDDSVSMWMSSLMHIKTDQFEVVTKILLGKETFAFGFLKILERLDVMEFNQYDTDY